MVQAQTQDLWQGGTGDFNVASNWNTGVVPISGYAANNDTGSNNVCEITANDPSFTFNGFRDGISASGGVSAERVNRDAGRHPGRLAAHGN